MDRQQGGECTMQITTSLRHLPLQWAGGGGHTPMIVEDFYKSRPPRVYKDISPTIRSERTGLMRVDVENERQE